MSRKILTDAEVEREIEKLQDSPFVQLARKELRLKYKQRQKLYNLRNLEKRGKELAAVGVTIDKLDEYIASLEKEETEQADFE